MQMATQHAQAINKTIDKASTELSRHLSQASFPSHKFRDPKVDVPDLRFAQQEPAWARKLNGIQPAGPSPPAPPARVPKLILPRVGLADESDSQASFPSHKFQDPEIVQQEPAWTRNGVPLVVCNSPPRTRPGLQNTSESSPGSIDGSFWTAYQSSPGSSTLNGNAIQLPRGQLESDSLSWGFFFLIQQF